MSYRKHEPPIHVFISWVEFCLRAPARSPILTDAAGLRGEQWRPSLALSDSKRSQCDRSWLAFPCYLFSSINYSCKLPIRLWKIRALIGKVIFLSVWRYWCLPFLFSGRSSAFYAVYYFFHVEDRQEWISNDSTFWFEFWAILFHLEAFFQYIKTFSSENI